MKCFFALAILILSGCSSLDQNCNQEKNWVNEGKNSVLSQLSPETALAAIQTRCEERISPESIAEFDRGRKLQEEMNCTGSDVLSKSGWLKLGQDVALRGETVDTYKTFKSKCSLAPTPQELKEYTLGFQQSLEGICSLMGGMEFARQGRSYKSTCPKEKEKSFFQGQKIGMKLKEIDDLTGESKNTMKALEELQKDTIENERTAAVCTERLTNGPKSGEVTDRTHHKCYTHDPELAEMYKAMAKKKVYENNLKIVEMRSALEANKSALELKYKELELVRSMLEK